MIQNCARSRAYALVGICYVFKFTNQSSTLPFMPNISCVVRYYLSYIVSIYAVRIGLQIVVLELFVVVYSIDYSVCGVVGGTDDGCGRPIGGAPDYFCEASSG